MAENNRSSTEIGNEQSCNFDCQNPDSFPHNSSENDQDYNETSSKAEKQASDVKIVVDDTALAELEKTMTAEELDQRKREAASLKEEGNRLYGNNEVDDAAKLYTKALLLWPLACTSERSVSFANRGACYYKQEKYDEAIEDCTRALDLNPSYLKVLVRRAELYEKKDKLDEALIDYQKAYDMDRTYPNVAAACMRLPEQIKERNEKLKTEMIGKLKELGNMVLRPFGLSTNNFQMQQDPNTGSYSINFKQNARN